MCRGWWHRCCCGGGRGWRRRRWRCCGGCQGWWQGWRRRRWRCCGCWRCCGGGCAGVPLRLLLLLWLVLLLRCRHCCCCWCCCGGCCVEGLLQQALLRLVRLRWLLLLRRSGPRLRNGSASHPVFVRELPSRWRQGWWLRWWYCCGGWCQGWWHCVVPRRVAVCRRQRGKVHDSALISIVRPQELQRVCLHLLARVAIVAFSRDIQCASIAKSAVANWFCFLMLKEGGMHLGAEYGGGLR